MDINLLKSLHIIFVISWFAGLFYLVRLFVYHVEAYEFSDDQKDVLLPQYHLMEKRLMYAITMPAMVGAVVTGLWMAFEFFAFQGVWLHVKLFLVLILLIYHFYCLFILNKLKKHKFWSSQKFRMFNEVATVLMVAIVFLVEYKQLNPMYIAITSFVMFGILVFSILKFLKKNK